MSYGYPQQFQQPVANGYQTYKPMQYNAPTQWTSISQVRPVTSLEEVKAYPIEFDGSIFYFPDNANKRIYTKFINLDGTVSINMYELKELNTDQHMDGNFVTRQEFDNVVSQLRMMLESKTSPAETVPQAAAQQLKYEF